MRMIRTKWLTTSVVAFSICTTTEAQLTSRYSVGVNLGTFVYSGDLSPWRTGSWKTPAFVFGFTGNRVINSTLSARLDLNFGKLRGDDAAYGTPEYRRYRAFAFNSRVTGIVVGLEYSPLGTDKKLSPYLLGGIGYAGMKITRDYSRFNEAYFANEANLKDLLGEDIAVSPPRGVAVFPAGLGLKYSLNHKFSLHAEAAHRFTFSDYIDGFSQSVNPNKSDSYTKYSLGLRLHLGNNDPYACPPIRY